MAHSASNITDSEFSMWRTVFAFALVDNVLSVEEQELLKTYYSNVPFSNAQRTVLKEDFKHPQNIEALFKSITEQQHKERFCVLARALVWCEGNMNAQEHAILKRVGCLGEGKDREMLKKSRYHPSLKTYHEYYARTGVMGLGRMRPSMEISI